MGESMFEEDKTILFNQWYNFVSLIRQDRKELSVEKRQLMMDIQKIEKISKVLEHGKDNIDFLLLHKESIISMDDSLKKDFLILDSFKNKNNLTNPVALRYFNEIINSKKVNVAINHIKYLTEKKDKIENEISSLDDLIQGNVFDIELIYKYIEKHNLSQQEKISILTYVIFKSARKRSKTSNKEVKKVEQIKPDQTIKDVVKSLSVQDLDNIDNDHNKVDESPNYLEKFKELEKKYIELCNKYSSLLNKYHYHVLQNMTITEHKYYKSFCSRSSKELDESKIEGNYDEANSKISAIRVFDIDADIQKIIDNIKLTDYSDKEEIDLLVDYLIDFENTLVKLSEIDKRMISKEIKLEDDEEANVFFLVDRESRLIISDEIRGRGYYGNILNIIHGEQNGKNNKTELLKVSKKFSNEFDREIFAARDDNIIVSYIRLQGVNGSKDNGIMFLTASLLHPNNIQSETNKVIRNYKDQIMRSVDAIEKGEPYQLGLQSIIRKEIERNKLSADTLGEGELGGRNTK